MLVAACALAVTTFGCAGSGGAGDRAVATSRRVVAEQRFPLSDGATGLVVRVRPAVDRLAVRALVLDAVEMPGVSAAEADYDVGAVRVVVDGTRRDAVKEALSRNGDVVAAIEFVGGI